MSALSLTYLWAFLLAYRISASYVLSPDDIYQGNTFFEKFNFFTEVDPNVGFVQYQDQNTATNSKLISVNEAKQVYIGVDYQNIYNVNEARGRPSIRLETKKTYQYGLFVFDLSHMPSNTCGKWSAFWTTNEQDWPRWGEIDIIENIHENNTTMEALHTGPGCNVAGNQISGQMTGKQATYNCDGAATSSSYGSQSAGQGCVAENTNPNSYGNSFNEVGGGVYAMEWHNQAINIWQFHHENVPQDLSAGTPNPNGWGPPVFTTLQGACNIDDHFKDQRVIIDSAFCGNWAGQDSLWQQTSCYKSDPAKYPTCSSYVAANPGAYKESFWLINSLKVYQNIASNTPNAQAAGSEILQSSSMVASQASESYPSETSSLSPDDEDAQPDLLTRSSVAVETSSQLNPTQNLPAVSSSYASASIMPPSYANGTQPAYRATATSASYTPVRSASITQTIVPIEGDSGSNPVARPTGKEETAGGPRSVRVGGSSVLALIAAITLGMLI